MFFLSSLSPLTVNVLVCKDKLTDMYNCSKNPLCEAFKTTFVYWLIRGATNLVGNFPAFSR